jgi:hypothetical protein
VRADTLSPAERERLGPVARLLDCNRVRLYRGTASGGIAAVRRLVLWASRGRAIALGNHVFLPDRCAHDLPVLAHELTHCAQYQRWGPLTYFRRGAGVQLRDLLHRVLGLGQSPYHYELEEGKPLGAYGMEQQGQIVEDWFRRTGQDAPSA